jgi:hypothetical protein
MPVSQVCNKTLYFQLNVAALANTDEYSTEKWRLFDDIKTRIK